MPVQEIKCCVKYLLGHAWALAQGRAFLFVAPGSARGGNAFTGLD